MVHKTANWSHLEWKAKVQTLCWSSIFVFSSTLSLRRQLKNSPFALYMCIRIRVNEVCRSKIWFRRTHSHKKVNKNPSIFRYAKWECQTVQLISTFCIIFTSIAPFESQFCSHRKFDLMWKIWILVLLFAANPLFSASNPFWFSGKNVSAQKGCALANCEMSVVNIHHLCFMPESPPHKVKNWEKKRMAFPCEALRYAIFLLRLPFGVRSNPKWY